MRHHSFTVSCLALLVLGAAPAAQAQSAVPPPAGTIGWWPLDGSGADLGPSMLAGMAAGAGGAFEPAEVGDGFRPLAPDGHVAVPDADVLDVRRSFTIEAWVRLDALRADHAFVVDKGNGVFRTTSFALGIVRAGGGLTTSSGASRTGLPNAGVPFVTMSDGALEQVVFGSVPVPLGRFAHLACTVQPVNGSHQCRIYLDGSQVGFAWVGRLPFPGDDPLQIGGVAGLADSAVDGIVDEVTLYDRALTQAEVAAIVAAGPAGKVKPVFDDTPPDVAIDAPLDGAVVADVRLPVQARVSDESATTVDSSPSGVMASLPPGGGPVTGEVMLDPVDGEQLVTVRGVDDAGNAAAAAVTIVLDRNAPQLAVLDPLPGAIVGASPLPVTVQVDDRTAVVLQVAGQVWTLPPGPQSVIASVPLAGGPNSIAIVATDEAGNRSMQQLDVVLDLDTPLVTWLAPTDGALLGPGNDEVAAIVQVDDLGATTVASSPAGVDGSLPEGGGLLTGAIALQEGLNVLDVAATDPVGRVGGASVTVNLDRTAPLVAFSSPESGALLAGTVEVSVSARDVAPGSGIARMELWSGAQQLGASASGTLELALDSAMLADGSATLSAVAVDGAGNRAVVSLPVTIDNTAPSLRLESPLAGTVTGLVPFVVVADDAGSGVVEVRQQVGGGAPSEDGSTSWATPQPSVRVEGREDSTRWPDGNLVFEADATDAAGNSAHVEVTVTVQNVVPEPPALLPADGARVHGVVELVLRSQDPSASQLTLVVDGEVVAQGAVSPLRARIDTRTHLDGPLQVRGTVRGSGGTAETLHTLQVDNIHVVALAPSTLSLSSRRHGSVWMVVRAPEPALLQRGHDVDVTLAVPGGTPVRARQAGGGRGWVLLRFERSELVASLRAAQAIGALDEHRRRVPVRLQVGGTPVGEAAIRLTRTRARCGR